MKNKLADIRLSYNKDGIMLYCKTSDRFHNKIKSFGKKDDGNDWSGNKPYNLIGKNTAVNNFNGRLHHDGKLNLSFLRAIDSNKGITVTFKDSIVTNKYDLTELKYELQRDINKFWLNLNAEWSCRQKVQVKENYKNWTDLYDYKISVKNMTVTIKFKSKIFEDYFYSWRNSEWDDYHRDYKLFMTNICHYSFGIEDTPFNNYRELWYDSNRYNSIAFVTATGITEGIEFNAPIENCSVNLVREMFRIHNSDFISLYNKYIRSGNEKVMYNIKQIGNDYNA